MMKVKRLVLLIVVLIYIFPLHAAHSSDQKNDVLNIRDQLLQALADPPRPQIPKQNFEWTGNFIGNPGDLPEKQLLYDLVVRGKWQTGEDGKEYFNLYMEQGDASRDTWVENFIYEDKLYSITHKWHIDDPDINFLLGVCFQNMVYNKDNPSEPLNISVDDLNRGLDVGSRLVGVEIINGKPMNHFRHSCLARTAPQLFFNPDAEYPVSSDPESFLTPFAIPFEVFSDIYVPVGRPYPWNKWLQFGDGVGPDPQNDEWFLANNFNDHPDDIILPEQCQKDSPESNLAYVQQTTCKNLAPEGGAGVTSAASCGSIYGCLDTPPRTACSPDDDTQCQLHGLQCFQVYYPINDFCCCAAPPY